VLVVADKTRTAEQSVQDPPHPRQVFPPAVNRSRSMATSAVIAVCNDGSTSGANADEWFDGRWVRSRSDGLRVFVGVGATETEIETWD
jgi:hypothetical protein